MAQAGVVNYMAEVRLRVELGTDLAWIRQSLDAACRRVDGTSPSLKILSAVHVTADGRLSCIVTAAGREDVLRLFEIALLPSVRVLEVVDV
jgi:hypothetical protein